MKQLVYTLALVLLASTAMAQYTITALNTQVTENFNGFPTSPIGGGSQGVDPANGPGGGLGETFSLTALPNWYVLRRVGGGSGTAGSPLFSGVDNGTDASGAVYNYGTAFGTASDNNRMIGSIGSSSTAPSFGTSFLNSTGLTVTAISVEFSGHQWRTGGRSDINEILEFQHRVGGGNDIVNGTWVTVPALVFNELNPTNGTTSGAGSNGPVNGTDAANRTASPISATITGLSIPNGTRIWFRWNDTEDTGNDNAFAIDNLVVTATTGTSTEQTESAAVTAVNSYPNPARGRFTVEFGLSRPEKVSISLYDLTGSERKLLAAERTMEAGAHQMEFSTDQITPGLYMVAVKTSNGRKTTKVVVAE